MLDPIFSWIICFIVEFTMTWRLIPRCRPYCAWTMCSRPRPRTREADSWGWWTWSLCLSYSLIRPPERALRWVQPILHLRLLPWAWHCRWNSFRHLKVDRHRGCAMSPAPLNSHKTMVVIKTIKQKNTWQIIEYIDSINNNNSRWLYIFE